MGPRPLGRGRRPPKGLLILGTRLQWGRDLSAAEGLANMVNLFLPFQLQWGRDLSAAEGLGFRRRRRRRRSFNGAATSRPRKVRAAECPPSRPTRFNGAATSRPRKARGRLWAEVRFLLQWGRDLSAAEGASVRVKVVPQSGRFNGAATSRPRKAGVPCAPFTTQKDRFNGAATSRPRKGP